MSDFNKYVDNYDYAPLIRHFLETGTCKTYKKGDFLCMENKYCHSLGWIQKGAFRYVATASDGAEKVVGYAFENSFVGNYTVMQRQKKSAVTIQAICDSAVLELSSDELNKFYDSTSENQRFAREVAEVLLEDIYDRYLSFYIHTPEERYDELTKRFPDILNLISLKELASYLNIRPETLSRIRKKIVSAR